MNSIFRATVAASILMVAGSIHAASFNCAKASSAVEKEICGSPHLSNLDSELGALYKRLLGHYGPGKDEGIKSAQRTWVSATRDRCTSSACLMEAYENKVDELRTSLSRLSVNTDDIEGFAPPPEKSVVKPANKPPAAPAAPVAKPSTPRELTAESICAHGATVMLERTQFWLSPSSADRASRESNALDAKDKMKRVAANSEFAPTAIKMWTSFMGFVDNSHEDHVRSYALTGPGEYHAKWKNACLKEAQAIIR